MIKMKIILLFLVILIGHAVHAQDPVSWEYASKNIGGERYEISITAMISGKWHLYSQFTPEGGPLPTKILFANNPMLEIEGGVKEDGRLQEKLEEVFDMKVKYFEGMVVFRQIVKLKRKINTKVAGTIEYMVCDDTQCLPPKKLNFSIDLKF
jgi:hypothetical protein